MKKLRSLIIFFVIGWIFFAFSAKSYASSVNVSGTVDPTVIAFSGESSPGAVISFFDSTTLLGTTKADTSGNFSTSFTDQTAGSHTYSMYATDTENVQTSTLSFSLTLPPAKTTNAPNTLLPPTINVNETSTVDQFTFSGQTNPTATVNLQIDGTLTTTIASNTDGTWSKTIDEGTLSVGSHSVNAFASLRNKEQSENSETLTFLTIVPPTQTPSPIIKPTPQSNTPQFPPLQKVISIVQQAQSSPAVKNTEKVLQGGALVGAISSGAAAAGPGFLSLINYLLLFAEELPIQILRLILALLEILGIRNKARPWGVVYDSVTKQPIDPAIVNLTKLDEPDAGKKETHITDFQGRFGFLVERGRYRIDISKQGYRFPSEVLSGKGEDEDRSNLYFGTEITFDQPDVINVNIPMDPLAFNWNAANKPIQYKPSGWRRLESISNVLFVLGFSASILFYMLDHSIINLVLLLLYPVFWLISIRIKRKGWGVIYDQATRKITPLLTVKAMKEAGKDQFKVLAGFSLTDHLGRYYLILNEGRYVLQVLKDTPEGKIMVKQTEPFIVGKKNSLLKMDIGI